MKHLFDAKDYSWSLFLGHIVIEKLLKAYFVKKYNEIPPFIHDLLRLAEKCNINMTETIKDSLDIISTFNIGARYDNYKEEFYRKCTKKFADENIERIKDMRKWIKNML